MTLRLRVADFKETRQTEIKNMLLLVNLRNLKVEKHSKGAGEFVDDIICENRVGPGLREKTSAVYSFVVGK